MSININQFARLEKKFGSLKLLPLEKSVDGTKIDVFAVIFQSNGLPGKMSQGLIEANAMWDEKQSRPKGYFITGSVEKENGVRASIMVSEVWMDNNKVSAHEGKWAETVCSI